MVKINVLHAEIEELTRLDELNLADVSSFQTSLLLINRNEKI